MKKFSEILKEAAARKGGEKELMSYMPKVITNKQLAEVGDDRFLAMMAKCIFQAGFVWRVIVNKWPGFEEVFYGFDPATLIALPPDEWDKIGQDTRIVRNMQKITSVHDNARFVSEIAAEHGSFAKFIAEWPEEDLNGLLLFLKKNGSRLGGMTGQRVLRLSGKDTYILTKDVVSCLQFNGVDIADNPTSQRDMKSVQEAFNTWHKETGLPYTHLSKIMACSVGENYDLSKTYQENGIVVKGA